MTGSQVRVVYRKYDGSLHWNHTGIHLGEDEYGRWVATPGGTPVRRGQEPPIVAQSPNVLLFPRDGWWTGCFNAAPHRTEIYCDITTVPQWTEPAQWTEPEGSSSVGSEVSMVDLDLDVRRRRAGEVELLDADEFAAHQVRFGYPAEVIARAQATADWLTGAVRGRVEPFGTAYHRWLDQVI